MLRDAASCKLGTQAENQVKKGPTKEECIKRERERRVSRPERYWNEGRSCRYDGRSDGAWARERLSIRSLESRRRRDGLGAEVQIHKPTLRRLGQLVAKEFLLPR